MRDIFAKYSMHHLAHCRQLLEIKMDKFLLVSIILVHLNLHWSIPAYFKVYQLIYLAVHSPSWKAI